jgi:hypothetical protein
VNGGWLHVRFGARARGFLIMLPGWGISDSPKPIDAGQFSAQALKYH